MAKRPERLCFLPDMRKETLKHTFPPDRLKSDEYPFRYRRLAWLKKGVFRPDLPSLRLCQMDDVRGKLSDEHARHTTLLTPEEFERGVCTVTRQRRFRLPDECFKEPPLRVPPVSWKQWMGEHKRQWESFRLANFEVDVLKYNDRNMHFNGATVIFTHPEYPPPIKFQPRCSPLKLRPADTKFNWNKIC